jgi:hypothetical protein
MAGHDQRQSVPYLADGSEQVSEWQSAEFPLYVARETAIELAPALQTGAM